MRNRLISVLLVVLLLVPLASATIRPNETMEDYQKRVRAELPRQNFVCGNGICEGLEFNECPQDCSSSNTTPTAKKEPGPSGTPSTMFYIASGVLVFGAIVVYSLRKYKTGLKAGMKN